MKQKNLTLIFKNFEIEHINKEVFMVPYYLGKINNMNVKIVCPETESNKELGNKIDGVELIKIANKGKANSNSFYLNRKVLTYLLKNARQIDLFLCFHAYYPVIFLAFIYRILNKRGLIYNRADGGGSLVTYRRRMLLKKKIHRFFFKIINYISFEGNAIYSRAIDIHSMYRSKMLLIPNGFNEDKFQASGIIIKDLNQKENIILSVGRLGSHQKNTEMLLRIAETINLKNWTILLIGPIEEHEQNFKLKIEDFYKKNPQLKDKVIFKGPIYDKNELWKYYNKTKVFLMTSREEGYANVYCEAYRFSNYILSTDVGGARDSIPDGYGAIFDQEKELASHLQSIIDEKIDLKSLYGNTINRDISWENLLKVIKI